jgi:uncharacterized protein YndB with AHSA1/START domain
MASTRIERVIAAPRADVYRALLDPAAVAEWQVPDGMTSQVHAFDARVGGAFRITLTYRGGEAGKSSEHADTFHGTFVELEPDHVVVQRVAFETSDPALQGEMTIRYELSDGDGGTLLRAVHDDLPPGVAPADNELGWRMSLDKLDRWVTDHPGRSSAPRSP